jgi:hypothetical protein
MNEQQRAVIEQALYALEKADSRDGYYSYEIEIEALRQLLEQPASQRSENTAWVGLTTTERKEIERQSVYVEGAIRMADAKLREKNGGKADQTKLKDLT